MGQRCVSDVAGLFAILGPIIPRSITSCQRVGSCAFSRTCNSLKSLTISSPPLELIADN